MELYTISTLPPLALDEKNTMTEPSTNLPVKANTEESSNDLSLSPPRPSNSTPGSPWTLSPLRTPLPPLLYQCISSLHRCKGDIYSIAIFKGIVFTSSDSNRIRVWRQLDFTDRGYIKASYGDVRAMVPYGHNKLFTAHGDNKIRLWNFKAGSEKFQYRKLSTLPRKCKFFLFPKQISSNEQHKDRVSCMAYYRAEGLLYTGSYDMTVKAWRVSDNKFVDSFVAHEDQINGLIVNQDDGCVFTCSSDGCVRVWRRIYRGNPHTLTMTLKFRQIPVNALALSTIFDQCFLYSGSSDGTINFWEKEKLSGRFNHGGFLQGHRFAVLCLASIGKLIFSGSEDTTIRVWRRNEESCLHECLAVLDGHRGPVRCLVACLEIERVVVGFLLYSASSDRTFKVWKVREPGDEGACLDYMDQTRSVVNTRMRMEYDSSPTLSPSWVEKKLQSNYYFD